MSVRVALTTVASASYKKEKVCGKKAKLSAMITAPDRSIPKRSIPENSIPAHLIRQAAAGATVDIRVADEKSGSETPSLRLVWCAFLGLQHNRSDEPN